MRNDEQWWRQPLHHLSDKQWEALCDGCGLCCLNKLEEAINNIPGVVTNGIFARQAADVVITAYQSGRIGTR